MEQLIAQDLNAREIQTRTSLARPPKIDVPQKKHSPWTVDEELNIEERSPRLHEYI